MAEDNYQALQSFFLKFPDFVNNDFYVFGESYGGIYVPTLAAKIAEGSAAINLKVSMAAAPQATAMDSWGLDVCVCVTVNYRMAETEYVVGRNMWSDGVMVP